ncbi:hypothetical protein OG937_45670 [Streptomyces sp. NBC_00510]
MRTTASTNRRSSTTRHPVHGSSARRRMRTRHGDIGIDTATSLLIDLHRTPDSAGALPRGRAAGRYSCLSCGRTLELCGPRDHADFTARFRHTRLEPDRCPARPEHLARVRSAVADAQSLAHELTASVPTVRIQLAVTAAEPGAIPVLSLRVHAPSGISVIHLPHGELAGHQASRILAVRDPDVRQWVLFNRHAPAHYRTAGQIHVRTRRQDHHIDKITPTPGQRRLAQSHLAVAWRDHGTLLLPFGGHPVTHQPRTGENWSGPAASWQQDWKISHPRPADGAVWWGLLPLPLRAVVAPTLLGAATTAMAELESAQTGREAYRRSKARERYALQASSRPVRPQQLHLPIATATAAATEPGPQAAGEHPPTTAGSAPELRAIAVRQSRPRRWRLWRSLLARLRRR